MHMQNQPSTMQQNPYYHDVVTEVLDFLKERRALSVKAGIAPNQIILDPGFGFGKNLMHNLALFNGLDQFFLENHPILVGVSRKSMIGQLLNEDLEERLIGSVTMGVLAAQKMADVNGSLILRVHDVKETSQALTVWQKIAQSKIG
jgi:dihydropteroate synthase